MLKTSYRVIIGGILSMITASVCLYLDILLYLSYAMLIVGFFAVGIGILLGFLHMIREDH